MAILYNDNNDDRESWVRIAIQFARRGILVQGSITIHGPHDSTNNMWGEAEGEKYGEYIDEFEFSAKANGSKYRPFHFQIWQKDTKERYPILKVGEQDRRTRRWMRAAERTLLKLTAERQAAKRESERMWAKLSKEAARGQ